MLARQPSAAAVPAESEGIRIRSQPSVPAALPLRSEDRISDLLITTAEIATSNLFSSSSVRSANTFEMLEATASFSVTTEGSVVQITNSLWLYSISGRTSRGTDIVPALLSSSDLSVSGISAAQAASGRHTASSRAHIIFLITSTPVSRETIRKTAFRPCFT